MKKESIKILSEHYFKNIELGIYYLDLAKQANDFGLSNLSKYIIDLSNDKLIIHKNLIYEYFLKTGDNLIGNLNKIKFIKFKNAKMLVENICKIEKEIKNDVNNIANILLNNKDHESYNFWQWFIGDVLKDLSEILYIKDLFSISNDMLLIDHMIAKVAKNNK